MVTYFRVRICCRGSPWTTTFLESCPKKKIHFQKKLILEKITYINSWINSISTYSNTITKIDYFFSNQTLLPCWHYSLSPRHTETKLVKMTIIGLSKSFDPTLNFSKFTVAIINMSPIKFGMQPLILVTTVTTGILYCLKGYHTHNNWS